MDHFKRSHQMGAEEGRREEDAHIVDCRRGSQGDEGEGDTGSVTNRQSGGWRSELTSRIDGAEERIMAQNCRSRKVVDEERQKGWGWACGFRTATSARASRMSKKAATPKKWTVTNPMDSN
jgi:hypothetical protein